MKNYEIYQYEIEELDVKSFVSEFANAAKTLPKERLSMLGKGFNQIMDYAKQPKLTRKVHNNRVIEEVLKECADNYDKMSDEEKAATEALIEDLKKELGLV